MNLVQWFKSLGDVYLNNSDCKNSYYIARRIHPTKKGPSRSIGMRVKHGAAGTKLSNKAFAGIITLINGIGAAGRLSLEGKLGNKKH